MKTQMTGKIVAALLLVSAAGSALAAPITFPFRFADPDSTAQALGSITFESTLLQNPGIIDVSLPDPAVLALNVTVSGSASGNGVFGIGDFTGVVFDTGGATLDLGTQLVGQTTPGGPWGTPDGNTGDFNLFSGAKTRATSYSGASQSPAGANSPPDGVNFFTLGADGGSDEEMVLTAMGFSAAPAVEPANLPIGKSAMLVIAGLLAFIGVFGLRRRTRKI